LFDLLDPHQGGRARVVAHANVLKDFLEIQVPVFSVDDDPIEPKRDDNLGNTRRFQCYPKAQGQLPLGKLSLEQVLEIEHRVLLANHPVEDRMYGPMAWRRRR